MKPQMSKHADYTTPLDKLTKASVIHARHTHRGGVATIERRMKAGIGKKWVPLGEFKPERPGDWSEVVAWSHRFGYAAHADRNGTDFYMRKMR